jgi:hypothetical protein
LDDLRQHRIGTGRRWRDASDTALLRHRTACVAVDQFVGCRNRFAFVSGASQNMICDERRMCRLGGAESVVVLLKGRS